MRKLINVVLSIIGLVLLFSGFLTHILEFLTWLVILDFTKPSISIVADIFVRFSTFTVTYSTVGALFYKCGAKIMSFAYFVISTLVSFSLCYLFMLVETHMFIMAIILGVILLFWLGFNIFMYIRWRKEIKTIKESKTHL